MNLPECSTYQPIIDIDDEESKETFKGWSKEDYLRATQIASIIKETMLDAMLDIFEHPENFVIDNSIAISDILARNIGNEEQSGLEIIAGLYQNCNVNFNETRIHSNIARIKGVMEQDISDLNNGTFQDIQSIVNQIIPEISNPNLEDETERQTQSDINKLVDKGTQELEEEKKLKYNLDNIFKNNNKNVILDNTEEKQKMALIEIKNIKWYTKIWRFLSKFLKKGELKK